MSTGVQTWPVAPGVVSGPDASRWFAVHTRARHEKRVAERLQEQGMASFLPVIKETHRWSDRKKTVEVPLFSCYVFVRMVPGSSERVRVVSTDGVLQIVGGKREGMPIPDDQIDAVRMMLAGEMPFRTHPYLKVGQRVRIRGGAMDGVEGVLLSHESERAVVVSVDVIQRSLAVRVEGYRIDPV